MADLRLRQKKTKIPSSSKKFGEDEGLSGKGKDAIDLSGLFDNSSEAIAKGKALAKKYKQKGGE